MANKQSIWKDQKTMLSEVISLVEEFGQLPPRKKLYEINKGYLYDGICKYHGGMKVFAKKHNMPYEPLIKPPNYWIDFENLRREIQIVIDKTGFFPTYKTLYFYGKWQIPTAINAYHGGFTEVARKMGYYIRRYYKAKDGHNVDSFFEYIVDNALYENNIAHIRPQKITFGTTSAIPDFLCANNWLVEVLMFDYREVIPEASLEQHLRKKNDRRQREYALRYYKKRIAYNKSKYNVFEFFPSDFKSEEAFNSRFKDLCIVLGQEFSEGIFFPIGQNQVKPPGYWLNLSHLDQELRPITKKIGHFPTLRELESMGRWDIAKGIDNHGIEKVANFMGYDISDRMKTVPKSRKPANYWRNFNHIKDVLIPLCEKNGGIPLYEELQELGFGGMIQAIQHFGGRVKVAKLLGFPCTNTKRGRWTKEDIESELIKVIDQIDHFPTSYELQKVLGLQSLYKAIKRFGGKEIFEEKLKGKT